MFAQTMGYVAATAGLFALGAYLGHRLAGSVGIAAFACLIGMQFAARRSQQFTVGLLGAFGLLVGLALAPVLAAYAIVRLVVVLAWPARGPGGAMTGKVAVITVASQGSGGGLVAG